MMTKCCENISSRLMRISAISALAFTVVGCAVGPDFRHPVTPPVEGYLPKSATASVSTDITGVRAQQLVDDLDIPGQWWTLFQSRPLNELIDQAIRANPDLQAAQAALRNAQETFLAGRGALFPSVDLSLQPTRQKIAEAAVSSSAADGSTIYNLHTAQLSVGYSPDVFGGVGRGLESLQAQADIQRFQVEATYLSLTSNVANAAVQEASLRGQIEATRETIDINKTLLKILQHQNGLGHTAVTELAIQEAALAQAQATLPPLEKQLAQQRNMLAVLVGRFPSDELSAHFDLASLQLPQELPLSLPSKLVEQRPDVRAAEENLRAANAQIGVSIANRLPNITLSASLGSTAFEIAQLFTPGTGFWMVAGSLAQPLFRGGTLLHQERAARAAFDQAAAQYRSVVLSAFRDVADTLHAIQADTSAYAAALAAEHATEKGLTIAMRQFELGDISHVAVLLAEQSYLQAKLSLVQAQASRFSDTVALFQALGGGWWNRSDIVVNSSSGESLRH